MILNKKLILGSGIVGLLARKILGSDWSVIPFNKSRFYSFNPALHDNYIIRDERIDDIIKHLNGTNKYFYKIGCSINGEIQSPNKDLIELWLERITNNNYSSHLVPLMSKRHCFNIYDIRINKLYQQLQTEFHQELIENNKIKIEKINKHSITTNFKNFEYKNIISTIPLSALNDLLNVNLTIESKPLWYHYIQSDNLNFEGHNQLLVINDFEFIRCLNIAPKQYLFMLTEELPIPAIYYSQFMTNFDIIDGTMIQNALICGQKPDLNYLKNYNITCIGDHAEWDYGADVGSSLIKIANYSTN